MRSLLLLLTVLAVVAASAVVSETATASKPLGRVAGEFYAERMGRALPDGPIVRLDTITITVNAFDRTLEPAPCSTCPGLDSGVVVETSSRGTTAYQVTDVYLSGDTAWVYTLPGSVFRFHDGGSPGMRVVGTANSVGLFPTRDWYEQVFWIGTQHYTGYLASGNIHVFSFPN